MLSYVKGDLFQIPRWPNTYLAHACNAQGMWGSGIAKEFKRQFPESHMDYVMFCEHGNDRTGQAFVTEENIICLITSDKYGKDVSNPTTIIGNTHEALTDLADQLPDNAVVYSNKFNSGLFKVEWQFTEVLIKNFLEKRPDISWTVVEYE